MPGPLTELAIQIAVSQLGITEQGGNNRGAEVEAYQGSVGIDPGEPWCEAFHFWVFRRAAQQLGLVNPLPKTGSVLRAARMVEPITRLTNPVRGASYFLKHSEIAGHAGIVAFVNDGDQPAAFDVPDTVAMLLGLPSVTRSLPVPAGYLVEISGNTNKDGSREGNAVWLHVTPSPEVAHGGELLFYADMSRAAQPPELVT